MQIAIADVLSPDDLEAVRTALAGARFIDGRATAGWAAQLVKENLQAEAGSRTLDTARKLVAGKILGNETFRMAARPKALTPLLLSRYEPGMRYGSHVDDAVMQGIRTDVSFTLFLNDPGDYEGGELVIESAAGDEGIKLPAGTLFAYPSTALHHVAEVSKGIRLAAVGWARSYVRDAAKRELLFDLDTARRSLFKREGKTAEFDLMSKSVANLLRLWAED